MNFRESETVELKEIVVDDVKKEIVAFANSAGGTVYIGVADDGSIVGVGNPEMATQQIVKMVRDSIKPDITMFIHYETKEIDGKQILAVETQRGTDRPYYLAKKGLRPEGVFVRQGTFSVPAADTVIRRMIKETDGDSFENMRSLQQDLTFESTSKEFAERKVEFGPAQLKTLGILNTDGIYTNLGLSVCRNPKLANIFYRLELIEVYGTGMRKIMKAYESSGKVPVIETTENAFKIALPNLNEGSSMTVKQDVETALEEKVLKSVKRNGDILRRDVEEATGLGQTAAGRLLKKMLNKGLPVQTGQGRNTKYTLPD